MRGMSKNYRRELEIDVARFANLQILPKLNTVPPVDRAEFTQISLHVFRRISLISCIYVSICLINRLARRYI